MMNTVSDTELNGITLMRLPVSEPTTLPVIRLYSPHSARNARPPPSMPRIRPSTMKGRRIKPLLAPTIFIIAISSRRPKVASLMVFDMMNTDTNTRMTMRISEMTLTMFLIVTKDLA